MRSFNLSSFWRTCLYALAGGALAALALFVDPGFVADALAALPAWVQTVVVVFVGGALGGLARAKDGSTLK